MLVLEQTELLLHSVSYTCEVVAVAWLVLVPLFKALGEPWNAPWSLDSIILISFCLQECVKA